MFQIIATAWDRYWLFIYQGVIFCLFPKEFHRFTSLVQNSAVRGEAKQKSSTRSGSSLDPQGSAYLHRGLTWAVSVLEATRKREIFDHFHLTNGTDLSADYC